MEIDKITESADIVQHLSNFGSVIVKGHVITVSNDKAYDKDILGSWRRAVHDFIGKRTDGAWRSERGSTRMKRSDNCRYCRKKLGIRQPRNCNCYNERYSPSHCDCPYGYGSNKGYGYCDSEKSKNCMCQPFYIRLFNIVLVYKTCFNVVLGLPLYQKVRNETNHLFRMAHLLLLANRFCTPDKHSDPGCLFATIKLQRDVLYRIIYLSFNGNKKVQAKFKWMLKRKS